jgi:chlorophyll synthase
VRYGQSLPVAFGINTAKWICAASIDLTQLAVAGNILHDLVDVNLL